jgi:hypothetical protein
MAWVKVYLFPDWVNVFPGRKNGFIGLEGVNVKYGGVI